jgi:hypothetical protein
MVKKLLSLILFFSFTVAGSAIASDKNEDKKTGTEDTKNNEKEGEENLEEAEYTSENRRSQLSLLHGL